jgi:hypothetical protein
MSAQRNTNVDQFMKQAEQTRTPLIKAARIFCTTLKRGGHSLIDPQNSIHMGPLKERERIKEKSGGDVSTIHDGCRLNITFDDPKIIPHISAHLADTENGPYAKALRKLGWSVKYVGDFHLKPKRWGWVGHRVVLVPDRTDKYTNGEIILTQAGMQSDYYPQSHKLYETIRARVEAYDKDGTPMNDWDPDVLDTLFTMQDLHREGVHRFGLTPFIGRFAELTSPERDDPRDDIKPIDFEPV